MGYRYGNKHIFLSLGLQFEFFNSCLPCFKLILRGFYWHPNAKIRYPISHFSIAPLTSHHDAAKGFMTIGFLCPVPIFAIKLLTEKLRVLRDLCA